MIVLDSAKQREFVIRTHVQFEWFQARPFPVVDALAVLPVAFAAGLPVAFEQRARVIGEGAELRVADRGHAEAGSDRKSCNHSPFRAAHAHGRTPGSAYCKDVAGSRSSETVRKQRVTADFINVVEPRYGGGVTIFGGRSANPCQPVLNAIPGTRSLLR